MGYSGDFLLIHWLGLSVVPKVPKKYEKEGASIMYGAYDENQRKQLEEIFGEEYCEKNLADWDNSQAEYYDELEHREWERKCFEGRKGYGKDAHAYDHDIDNVVIMQLREDGKTLREIAELFGCSPSTIRNRLKILQMR